MITDDAMQENGHRRVRGSSSFLSVTVYIKDGKMSVEIGDEFYDADDFDPSVAMLRSVAKAITDVCDRLDETP